MYRENRGLYVYTANMFAIVWDPIRSKSIFKEHVERLLGWFLLGALNSIYYAQLFTTIFLIDKLGNKNHIHNRIYNHKYLWCTNFQDYEKYINWYTNKTQWGKIEKKHIKEQLEYQELAKKYEEQAKKNKKKGLGSEAGSVASTIV